MTLADVCIKRPVFTAMLILALVVLGWYSYQKLGVDFLPNVDLPVVTVTTTLKGASPEEIETEVTKPLEEVINTVNGIDELRSSSIEGVSRITVVFKLHRKAAEAAQDIRDKISTVLSKLPEGTDPPVVSKFDVDAVPIISIVVSGKRDLKEVTEIAQKMIKEDIETLDGIGSVDIIGGRKRAINIWLNPDKLSAYNISISQVKAALAAQNIEVPAGRVEQGQQELMLRTMGRFYRVEDFNNLILANFNNTPIRIKDVGYVEDGIEEPRTLSRLDGNNAVQLIVQKQSGTNTVEGVNKIKARLEKIKPLLPPDIQIHLIRDQSTFVLNSLEEVEFDLKLGIILASLAVLIFMWDIRSTLIASLAIPASIISTFTLMYLFGYTLNYITMLGLILAIGIVIDDAIVVLENIFRHMEEKKLPPKIAASTGTREISLAVMATTLSLVIIFIPLSFMQTRVGKFFASFGLTVAFSIMISLLVAFTLTPMLCSRFLKLKHSGKSAKESRFYSLIDRSYGWVLAWSLRHRWVILLISAFLCYDLFYYAVIGTPGPLLRQIGQSLIPRDDQDQFEISVEVPEGTTLEKTDEYFRKIEREVVKLRGVTHVLTSIGDINGTKVTVGNIYVGLIPVRERSHNPFESIAYFILNRVLKLNVPEKPNFSQDDVMLDARKMLRQFPDLRTSVQPVSLVSGSGNRPQMIAYNIRGPDLEQLQKYAEQIIAKVRNVPGFVDLDTTLSLRQPELRVNIDREKASDLGVTVEDITSSLRTFVQGEPVSKFKEGADQYDVWLRAQEEFRNNPEAIYQLTVPSKKAGLVKLANVATLTEARGPAQIDRQNRQRQITILANVTPVLSLSEAIQHLTQATKELNLPITYQTDFSGWAKTLMDANWGFIMAIQTSLVFMYMILAAQFESFTLPISIMMALPLTWSAAMISLILMKDFNLTRDPTLNIFSDLGLFMLLGVVKKNGILQVDYTNTLRAEGMERDKAILEANHARLRPILMTTLTLIAGMLPLVFGKGAGSASRASMANVIIWGQALSLLMTLLITPVTYTLFDDIQTKVPTWIARLRARIRGRKEMEPVSLSGVESIPQAPILDMELIPVPENGEQNATTGDNGSDTSNPPATLDLTRPDKKH
jgi:HAE1 family hydrophobic/amphiphilic exporter-1